MAAEPTPATEVESVPASDVAEVTTPVAASEPTTEQPAETPSVAPDGATPPVAPDPAAILATIAPADLERIPRVRDYLASRAGRLAQEKLAQERDAWEADRNRQDAERERLTRLRQMDPTAIGEQVLSDLDAAEERNRVAATLVPETEVRVYREQQEQLLANLPDAIATEIRTGIAQRRINDFEQMRDAIVAAREAESKQRWETEERTRIEQEVLAKYQLTLPRPDISAGTAPAPQLSDSDYLAAFNRGDPAAQDFKRVRAIIAGL